VATWGGRGYMGRPWLHGAAVATWAARFFREETRCLEIGFFWSAGFVIGVGSRGGTGSRGSVRTVFRCVGRWVRVLLRSGVFVSGWAVVINRECPH